MYFKRFASAALASVMALSLAAPAFAATETTITGTYTPITLDVTVPTTGKAILNPYGLPYKIEDKYTVSGQKITTAAALTVQNRSEVPLSVSVSIVSSPTGQFKFASAIDNTNDTQNVGVVKFQMATADGITETSTDDQIAQAFVDVDDADYVDGATLVDNKTADASGNKAAAATGDDILTLAAGDAGKLADGGAAFFRLSGELVQKPANEWKTGDGFTSKITFTFEPGTAPAPTPAAPENAGTLARDDGASDNLDDTIKTSVDLTLTPSLPAGVTVASWTWSSSDSTKISVAANGSDDKKATASWAAAGSATIAVQGTGSDGKTYKATIDLVAD